jgi:hypothetical protein
MQRLKIAATWRLPYFLVLNLIDFQYKEDKRHNIMKHTLFQIPMPVCFLLYFFNNAPIGFEIAGGQLFYGRCVLPAFSRDNKLRAHGAHNVYGMGK